LKNRSSTNQPAADAAGISRIAKAARYLVPLTCACGVALAAASSILAPTKLTPEELPISVPEDAYLDLGAPPGVAPARAYSRPLHPWQAGVRGVSDDELRYVDVTRR
jgi:hypothetical protein